MNEDRCKNCGSEKDDHYDGVQCPLGQGLYSAKTSFEYNPATGEELEEGCYMMAHNTPDGLCDPITGCPGCAQERRRRAREGK